MEFDPIEIASSYTFSLIILISDDEVWRVLTSHHSSPDGWYVTDGNTSVVLVVVGSAQPGHVTPVKITAGHQHYNNAQLRFGPQRGRTCHHDLSSDYHSSDNSIGHYATKTHSCTNFSHGRKT